MSRASGADGPATGTGGSSGDARRAAALARVRTLLADLGTSEEEIDQAVADDVVDLLVVDRLLVPAARRLTQGEVSEETGTPVELVRRLWRALGFLDVADDERLFTEMDVEAVRLFQSLLAMGVVDVETALQMARVIGSSMARIAEAEAAPGTTPVVRSSGDSVVDGDQFAQLAEASLPAMARLLEFVWRRHLQAATRRAMLLRHRQGPDGQSPELSVGFADMVGYTLLAQHLGEEELAAVVSRFEEVAHDIVTGPGGRVVKMIGDEVMFVVPSAADAAGIGLRLAEAYADDELLSDVRVGLAVGAVLVQDGDYYGPVVNLASRMVNIANPGTVLVSDDFRRALATEAPDAFVTRALRPRYLKDIGRVQMWRLARAGEPSGSTHRRARRWERLGEVLRELEELRGRGDRHRPGSVRRTGPSVGGEPESGDAVGREVEPSLDRPEG